MADTQAEPLVPVQFAEPAIAEDLAHHPPAARKRIRTAQTRNRPRRRFPFSRLKRCEAEGRDGTRLAGCVKTYVPWPTGRFGLVLLPVSHPTRPFALRAFAYGVRHPAANKLSVYQIADQRHNAASA